MKWLPVPCIICFTYTHWSDLICPLLIVIEVTMYCFFSSFSLHALFFLLFKYRDFIVYYFPWCFETSHWNDFKPYINSLSVFKLHLRKWSLYILEVLLLSNHSHWSYIRWPVLISMNWHQTPCITPLAVFKFQSLMFFKSHVLFPWLLSNYSVDKQHVLYSLLL